MDIYLQGMRDRSMRSGTELAREIKLPDWSMAGNLSNRSSGVQIPRDICTRLKRYLYSAKCSWIIILCILPMTPRTRQKQLSTTWNRKITTSTELGPTKLTILQKTLYPNDTPPIVFNVAK